jgi:hypothetical protein
MTDETDTASRSHTAERERQRREAALDETIEQSFPASDPLSSDPNPDSHSDNTEPTRRSAEGKVSDGERHDVSRADRGDLIPSTERTPTEL